MPFNTPAYAAIKPAAPLVPFTVSRRDLKPNDIHVHLLYVGICHSDIHLARGEWEGLSFPLVPGHEMVGRVEALGAEVTKFKVGDIVGIGCLSDSCGSCASCKKSQEMFCKESRYTCFGNDREGEPIYGGYCRDYVIPEKFAATIPASLHGNLAGVAPLLCAGITVWSALVNNDGNVPGKKVGVLGLGGLGHIAVKFAVAFGNEVTVISTSDRKKELALKQLGASNFINSKDAAQMTAANKTLDIIVDTVSAPKDIDFYMNLLNPLGMFVTVNTIGTGRSFKVSPFSLVPWSKGVAGSIIGGMEATQEMLNFCGEKQIYAMSEVITMEQINEAYDRVVKSDVQFRFSIDIEKSAFDCVSPSSTQASENY